MYNFIYFTTFYKEIYFFLENYFRINKPIKICKLKYYK